RHFERCYHETVPPPSRLRRWLRRVAGALAVLTVLALATAVMLVRSIDRPWLKRRLQAAALARSGAEIDWTATEVRVRSGLTVDGLSLRAHVERGSAGWRVRAQLGSAAAPLVAHVERTQGATAAGSARARLWADVDVTPAAASLGLDVAVVEQTLAPATHVREL